MPSTTLLRAVIARDLSKKIETVVKVYDRSSLADDLRQFVITDSLSKELRKFLDTFTDSLGRRIRGAEGGDGMAVWIWGFFGSGKSHVAKVLGHLLENAEVDLENHRTAIDLFNIHLDDPTLREALSLKASLAEIKQRAWCSTIAFEIKSKLDQANPDSVTEACLRAFYEKQGLATTVWLARLERKLQAEELYTTFQTFYQAQTGRTWLKDRPEHAFYEDEIAASLAETLGKPLANAREMLAAYQRDQNRVTPEGLAQEIVAYLQEMAAQTKPREPHLIFVIDEMGQFIGDSGDRIHEMQAIVEAAGVYGKGRIWFICTSQEALDQVVGRTGLRLSALGKLDARFSTKIALTGEDVQRVVQDRLLRKRESARGLVEQLYSDAEGPIEELCRLNLERSLATLNAKSFVAYYPFLPPIIPLVQELFNAMRGFKLSGSERSMIGLAQGALMQLADKPLGALASLDMLFDQVTSELASADYLGTTGIKLIRESDQQITGTPLPPSRVLKALWLISRVTWVPRTPEVLAKLLAPEIQVNLSDYRDRVQNTLEALGRAGLVRRDEATGQYRYLSEKERGIEEDILDAVRDYGIGTAKRQATEILKNKVLTRSKMGDYKIQLGKSGLISFSVSLDGEPISSGSEIVLEITSPLSAPKLEEIEQENLARGTRGRTVWWVGATENELADKLKRLEALTKIPELPKWRNDRSDETVRVVKDRERERSTLEAHLAGVLENCLKRGRLFYAGDHVELDGIKELKTVTQDYLGVVVRHLYKRFEVADKTFDEKNIPTYLKPDAKAVHRLDPELGLFDAQGHLVRSQPLAEAIFDELRRRQDESLEQDGKALLETFERIPYGWPEALVRLSLAAMFRGGAVHLGPVDTDQLIYDLGDARAEALFTKPTKFRSTRFYPTIGGLTPDEVRQAKQALITLGEVAVPDSAHGLAEHIRKVGSRMLTEASVIRQRVNDTNLPLPTTYQQAEPALKPALNLRDPVACVRKFSEDQANWIQIANFLASYQEFISQHCDQSFQTYRKLLQFARAVPAMFEDEAGQRLYDQVVEFDAIVKNRAILEQWKALQEAALAIQDAYRQAYRLSYEECRQAIAHLKTEIESAPDFIRLNEGRKGTLQAVYFSSGAALYLDDLPFLDKADDLVQASETRKISELDALRLAVSGYREVIRARCLKEWDEQKKERVVIGEIEKKKPEPKVHRINLRQRLAGLRVTNPDELQSAWQPVLDELKQKLADGYEIEFDF